MRTMFRLVPGLLLAGLIVAGCNRFGDSGTPGLAVGNRAPEIKGEDSDGRPFKLSDYRGKVVVLKFWSSG